MVNYDNYMRQCIISPNDKKEINKPCLVRKSASVIEQPCNSSPTGALILTGNLLLCVLKHRVIKCQQASVELSFNQ